MTPGESAHIRRHIREAKKAGFHAVKVWDGGEYQYGTSTRMTEAEVIDACGSVDDSMVYFRRPAQPGELKERGGVMRVILGNAKDGSEVVADHSVTPGFAEAMDRACAAHPSNRP